VDRAAVERELAAFLAERTRLDPPPPDLDLAASGLLDSLLLVELVLFVEERFGVATALDEVELENFATVARAAGFVVSRLA
jgi:methoxymalonate biosynthesis acyl carrier protein